MSLPPEMASAGTTYWFSPLNHNPDESAKFIWIEGTGGGNSSYQNVYSSGSISGNFVRSGDRGSAVPEPPTYLLIGPGLVFAALLRNRK
jgi:hypothetical protein